MKQTIQFSSEGLVSAGDLYTPDHLVPGQKYPAVLVGGSWTAVKEQANGAYAGAFANEDFIALAVDNPYFGGDSRCRGNALAKIAGYKHAVSFLRSTPGVDENNIFLVGICGGAGYMAAIAAADRRIGGIAMVASWLDDRGMVNRFNPMPLAQRLEVPTLMIHSDDAVLPCHVRRFFGEVSSVNKVLHWMEGGLGDFYAQPRQVGESVRVAAAFFKKRAYVIWAAGASLV